MKSELKKYDVFAKNKSGRRVKVGTIEAIDLNWAWIMAERDFGSFDVSLAVK